MKEGKLAVRGTADTAGEKRDIEFKEVKLEGENLTFVEMRQIQDNAIRIEFTGTVSEKGIQFTRKAGDFGSQDALATRVTAAGAPPASVVGESRLKMILSKTLFRLSKPTIP